MALAAADIIRRVSDTLYDTDNVRWPVQELREYLSDAQRAAVMVRPEANPVTRIVSVTPGTKQTLPADGWVLIEAVRNMGFCTEPIPPAWDAETDYSNGFRVNYREIVYAANKDITGDSSNGDPTTDADDWDEVAPVYRTVPGRAIRPTSRSVLDAAKPQWHSDRPLTYGAWNAKSFVYDIRNRKTFYVEPGAPETPTEAPEGAALDYRNTQRHIEIVYAKIPDEIESDDAPLELDDIYEPALIAYMLHRAYSKPSGRTGSEQMAEVNFNRFRLLLLGEADKQDADLTIRHETVESGRNDDGRLR